MVALKALTGKQEVFAQTYISNGRKGVGAYRTAYDVKTMSAQAINVEAGRLLRNPSVALRVLELTQKANQKAEMSIADIRAEYEKIAKASIDQVMAWTTKHAILVDAKGKNVRKTWINVSAKDSKDIPPEVAAAISEVKVNARDGTVSFKFHDKNAALKALGTHKGMFGRGNADDEVDDEGRPLYKVVVQNAPEEESGAPDPLLE